MLIVNTSNLQFGKSYSVKLNELWRKKRAVNFINFGPSHLTRVPLGRWPKKLREKEKEST